MKVLFLASEADPLIKVGGLGDVAGSLPKALKKVVLSSNLPVKELDIRLAIPYHPAIRKEKFPSRQITEFSVHTINNEIPVKVFALDMDGLPVYLIDATPFAAENGVYSSNLEADSFKYVFFSQAALTLARKLDWRPNILHANDWHTAAAVYSLALNRPIDPFFKHTRTVLTVHNLPYMGAMSSASLEAFDLPPAENTSLPVWANHMALPLGLLTSDIIVPVSPGYAKEILTEDFGCGLHTFLRAHSKKITGILNGLDTKRWDPSTDTDLVFNYSVTDLHLRSANKSFLQKELGFESYPHIPLVAMVTRMDPQKGVDIAVDSLRSIFQSGLKGPPNLQAVFLGTGHVMLEEAVRRMEQDYPDRMRACITYDEKLSRHIYAGADMLLMPSRYEPCGLSQMIAMRYGCLPIANSTGGLSDTILDPTDSNQSTGFLYKPNTPEALSAAIKRAMLLFIQDPKTWQAIQTRAMQFDFSWDRSARGYLEQYLILLENQLDHKKGYFINV